MTGSVAGSWCNELLNIKRMYEPFHLIKNKPKQREAQAYIYIYIYWKDKSKYIFGLKFAGSILLLVVYYSANATTKNERDRRHVVLQRSETIQRETWNNLFVFLFQIFIVI
jgi:hypothetical protein